MITSISVSNRVSECHVETRARRQVAHRVSAFVWIMVAALLTAAPVSAELIDNGDGTVTDTISHLMWLKNADVRGPMDFTTADAWARSLNIGGHTGWRLPSGANRDGSGTVCNSRPTGANCTNTEFATLYFARLIMFGNPGPFQNLRAGSYWTSTDLPGNPGSAMAQDFIDGGQNPFNKASPLYAWAVRDTGPIVLPIETPILYGISGGILIQIDTATAAVATVGDTGFAQACGLAFDRFRLKLDLSPCFGTPGLQAVNPTNGAVVPLGTTSTGVRSIAHRHIDDRIYGIDSSPALLRLDAETGGSTVAIAGIVDKRSVGGIATRPSDGRLFGVGIDSAGRQQLFTLNPATGSGPRDTNVGTITGAAIRAVTFHPDGRFLATDGTNLLRLNESTGAVLSRTPFTGPTIGPVNALAVTAPRLAAPPDVWIKDCTADIGAVPSSGRCPNWQRSPDIIVDNDRDGRPDSIVRGRTNLLRVTARNRGVGGAPGTIVRLYTIGAASTPTPTRPPTLVGSRTANIGAGEVTAVAIPWNASVASGARQCFAAVLDHPSDRVNSATVPGDNNKAVTCFVVP